MSFRRKLLAVFALTVFFSVGAVTLIISVVTRRAFERSDEERTATLVAQFQREFNRRGDEVLHRVQAIAASDEVTRMALALSQGTPDYGTYLDQAKSIADSQQLDFLEFVDGAGTIVSSAQWPAKFGYKDPFFLSAPAQSKQAFLKREELPDGGALGLFAVRQIKLGDNPLYVIGGRRIDRDFLASLELPAGMRAMFYQNLNTEFSPDLLIASSANVDRPTALRALVTRVVEQKKDTTDLIHWSANPADDETVHAIPLTSSDNQVLGVLLIGASRAPYVGVRQHIRTAGLLVGGTGILLAILLSGWAAARVTRPVEQLAEAAREVAAGNWRAEVPVTSSDELGRLAESFNQMTHELLEQKQRLVQTERVAAWRELARRLAHELKNPLFPLQLTVENLVRARQQTPEQFEEVFRESSATLLAEIANLKKIISRFSDFSKMPEPQFQRVDLNEIVEQAARLFEPQLREPGRPVIECRLELGERLDEIAADPDLLHRALSNLLLNALDAMPNGGRLTLRTYQEGDRMFLEVADTGLGLTPEECTRLFTPYYTSKEHGTGLGLAIVQSVITGHGGKISVQSAPQRGTTFLIELPRNLEKLRAADGRGSGAFA